MKRDEQRMAELRQVFFESAQEILHSLSEDALALEAKGAHPELIRSIRRAVHTLKGDSAVCGFREVTELAHELEDALDPEALPAKSEVIELVLASTDAFECMLAAYRSGAQPAPATALRGRVAQLRSSAAKPQRRTESEPAPAAAGAPQWTEYERLTFGNAQSAGKRVVALTLHLDPQCALPAAAFELGRRALQSLGLVLAVRPHEGDDIAGINALHAVVATDRDAHAIARQCRVPALISQVDVEPWQAADHAAAASVAAAKAEPEAAEPAPASLSPLLRVEAERIDSVMNLLGELIIARSVLQQAVHEAGEHIDRRHPLRGRLADAMAFHSRVLNQLQKSVMKIRMVELRQLFRRVPRIVRDTARFCGKDVALEMGGERTELDKTILDALPEPVMHVVRNAVDHGIETPQERAAAGKPPQGKVRMNAFHQAGFVVIEISDDGRGLDPARLRARAVEKKLLSAAAAGRLSDSEALDLIFQPGFSTASQISEVSGRGVGMDVVRSVVHSLKGTVSLESEPGRGTTVRVRVPLTLAIIKALLFRSGERLYAVPLSSVVEITRAGEADIHRVEQHEVLHLREQVITLIRMDRLAASANVARRRFFVVVVALGDRKIGLVVDGMHGEEELVVKSFDDKLVATDLVSGASVLGDGRVVLILNLAAVAQRLAHFSVAAEQGEARKSASSGDLGVRP